MHEKKKSKNFNKIRKKKNWTINYLGGVIFKKKKKISNISQRAVKEKNWTINYPGGVLIKLQNLGNT